MNLKGNCYEKFQINKGAILGLIVLSEINAIRIAFVVENPLLSVVMQICYVPAMVQVILSILREKDYNIFYIRYFMHITGCSMLWWLSFFLCRLGLELLYSAILAVGVLLLNGGQKITGRDKGIAGVISMTSGGILMAAILVLQILKPILQDFGGKMMTSNISSGDTEEVMFTENSSEETAAGTDAVKTDIPTDTPTQKQRRLKWTT